MTLIVEDGNGIVGANSYVTVAEVTAYLTDRNRQTENSWSTAATAAQEAAAIAATDFIDRRFGTRFKGIRCFGNLNTARTVMTFTVQPTDTQTVTLGAQVFTFLNTPVATNDVQIGANLSESIDNLVAKINEVVDPEVGAGASFADTMLIFAKIAGTGGNGISTTSTVTGTTFSFATTRGGDDRDAPQPLSFPRKNLFTRDGSIIRGVADRVKQATAEYAVRALVGVLQGDIVPDASGRVLTKIRVKVGPIETETGFEEGGAFQLAVYPAADGLFSEFLNPAGGVER